MKRWFELWVDDAGPRTRRDLAYGTLGFALRTARTISRRERVVVELAFLYDLPFIEFATGAPRSVGPLCLAVPRVVGLHPPPG